MAGDLQMARLELADQLEAYVKLKIDTGFYKSRTGVIEDALRRMMEQDEDAVKLLRLQQAVQAGIDSLRGGKGVPYTPDYMQQVRTRALKAAQEGRLPNPDVMP
jgi:putative addiction module CopG family antidote